MIYSEINGDLIKSALNGEFDVIAHGCNCQSAMGAGIAVRMASVFGCNKFRMEKLGPSIMKLGNIDYRTFSASDLGDYFPIKGNLSVVNAYTQFNYGNLNGPPIDYEALSLCMRKINSEFSNQHIGLPMIGAGLAGGDWTKIKNIIKYELKDCRITIVFYKK